MNGRSGLTMMLGLALPGLALPGLGLVLPGIAAADG